MEKICPYCGRIGALGKPCSGCGYVLQAGNKSAPLENIPGAPQAAPAQLQEPLPDSTAAAPPCTAADSGHDRFGPFIKKLVGILGWIVSIPVMLLGFVGVVSTIPDYKTNFLDGFSSSMLGMFFIFLGLVINHIMHFKSMKFSSGRYLKYALIGSVILFIVSVLFL